MKKIFRRITVIVLAFVLFFAVEKIFPTISSDLSISSKFDSVQNFTAHRGLSNVAPENTAPALEEAGKKGYYAAEFDITPTKDGVWILMHDDTLDRTTNGEGYVSDYTCEEIMNFSIDTGHGIENYPDLKVSTLEEALDICEKYSMRAMIEIKGGKPENMASVLEIIEGKNLTVEPLIIDFDSDRLEAVRALDSEIELWYLVSKIGDSDIDFAEKFNTAIAFNHGKISNLFRVRDVKEKGITCAAWTVDRLPSVDILSLLGVDYITTNRILP
ncbi:MAG: hypothetical protein IJ395_03520 [Clostridia bacterium]|nr:hypothetical protein [Clostridia bacterium]